MEHSFVQELEETLRQHPNHDYWGPGRWSCSLMGAAIGDTVGSVFEWDNVKVKDFPLFSKRTTFTDDTVMTFAIADALLRSRYQQRPFRTAAVEQMQDFGRRYPHRGYGGRFGWWLYEKNPRPYNSWGNGAAMRVAACGAFAVTLKEALELARASADVTHDHPFGIQGAQAVAAAIFLAKTGRSKEEIGDYLRANFYPLEQTVDEIRPKYTFDESCQGTVPQALTAFLESESFEDALRTAISLGGDSDTLAAITCSVAWPYYVVQAGLCDGLPQEMQAICDRTAALLPEEFVTLDRVFSLAALIRGGTFFRVGIVDPVPLGETPQAD